MNFKITVSLIALATFSATAAPIDQATILRYAYEPNANNDGGYRLEYETSDGQIRSEFATVKYVGEENTPVLSVSGSYSFIAPDGVTYQVSYLADENGFNPTGVHLPGNAAHIESRPVGIGEPPQYLPPNVFASLAG